MDKFVSADDLKPLISKKLQQLREKSQKTLEETAKELNLDTTQYIRLLKGDRLPRLDTMLNINKAYGFSLDWWFTNTHNKQQNKIENIIFEQSLESELIENFKDLDTSSKEIVLGMITNLNKNQSKQKKLISKYR